MKLTTLRKCLRPQKELCQDLQTVLWRSLITDWSQLSRNQKILFCYSLTLQNVHRIILYYNLFTCPSSPIAVQMKTTKQYNYKMKSDIITIYIPKQLKSRMIIYSFSIS